MKPRVQSEASTQSNGREKKGVTIQVQFCRSFEGDTSLLGQPASQQRRKPASSQPAQVSQKPAKLATVGKPVGQKGVAKPLFRSLKPAPISVTLKEAPTAEEGKRSGEEEESGTKSPSVGSHSAVCEAGKQVALLLHQNKMLENLVSELQGKLRSAEAKKPLKQGGRDITRSHPYFQALKSLANTCHRYLLAESPYVQSVHDVAVGFSYQSLLMSLDLARVCIGDSGKTQPRPYSKTESHQSSVCEVGRDQSESYTLRKRLLQYQSDKGTLAENWPKKVLERPPIPPLFEKVTASVNVTFTQIESTLASTHEKLSSLQSKLSSVRSTPRDTCDSESRDLCINLVSEIKKQQDDLRAAHFSYTRQIEELREEHGREMTKMREESEASEGRFRSLQREAMEAIEESKTKAEEIAALAEEISKLKGEQAVKSREIQALKISTQELESHVKEAKDSEKSTLWDNRMLSKKLSTEKKALESEIAAAKASSARLLETLHKVELRNERTNMTLCDLESRVSCEEFAVVNVKKRQKFTEAAPEIIGESFVFDFDSPSNSDQVAEAQRMLMEDFHSQLFRLEKHTEALLGDCSLLNHENSALLMDNSQLLHDCAAVQSCTCVFSRVFPQDLIQELNDAMALIKGKWEQELELEKQLRLEINLLQEENWTLKINLKEALQRSDLGSSVSMLSETPVSQQGKSELAPGSWAMEMLRGSETGELQSSNRQNSSKCPTALQEIADFELRMRSNTQPQPAMSTNFLSGKEQLDSFRPPSPFNLSDSGSSVLGRVLSEVSIEDCCLESAAIIKNDGIKDSTHRDKPAERLKLAAEIDNLVRTQFPGETELIQMVKRLIGKESLNSPPATPKLAAQGPFEGGMEQGGAGLSPCEEKPKQRKSQETYLRSSVESGGAPAYYNAQLRSAVLQLLSSTPRRPHLFSPSEAEGAVSALYSYCQLSAKEIEEVERARDVAAGDL